VGWTAFLDACVLYPMGTRDLLLRGAEAYLYQICWSPSVLEEVRRSLVDRQRCTSAQADGLIAEMTRAFPEALVIGYEELVSAMKNNEDDRHVLAAAVTAGADVIVTDNPRHFPASACEPYSIEVQTADDFLSYSFDLEPEQMGNTFLRQIDDLRKPAWDVGFALARLDERLPSFAAKLRTLPRVRAAAGMP